MKPQPRFTLAATTLDAPNARELARFYQRLLGWPVRKDEPDWVELAPPDGGAGLSFQTEPLFTPPRWPATRSEQQIMAHLDIEVSDLPSAVDRALTLGATLADVQPRPTYASCATRWATRSVCSCALIGAADRAGVYGRSAMIRNRCARTSRRPSARIRRWRRRSAAS
ncbi:VOC family protein [Streptomyces sp. 8K308]|uniref:VOC family protein n=1 Tax=Streptomyces sp. 8K308 TaxID=2530388 RepID=UPI001FB7457D|nr:VOC family protein [Streptomyces sp. 8K308]